MCSPLQNSKIVNFIFLALSSLPSESFAPVAIPKPEARPIKREIPPYNGFGSLEDSLATCLNLIPKPPQKSVGGGVGHI